MRLDIWHNVLWSRYKGRVFSALYGIAQQRGHDVRFIQMAETERARLSLGATDLSYHRYPFELLYKGSIEAVPIWRSVPRFFWRALTNKADFVIIAGYSAPQNWAQLAGLALRRTPRGVFCDSTAADRPFGLAKYLAKRTFFRRCQVILCYGQRSREYILSHGVDARRVFTRCQAAALPDDYDAASVPDRRAAHRSETPRFIYVGRLSPEKNLGILIDAFARLRAHHPDARLRLIGGGPAQDAIAAHVATTGLTDAVVFTGGIGQAELADEYLAATAMVLPSTSEPWGLVVNESLSYGCPVLVSTACGCVPELVHSGQTGYAFEPDDLAQLEQRMEDLIAEFGDARAVAERCLKVIGRFSPEAAGAQILDAVEAALKRA